MGMRRPIRTSETRGYRESFRSGPRQLRNDSTPVQRSEARDAVPARRMTAGQDVTCRGAPRRSGCSRSPRWRDDGSRVPLRSGAPRPGARMKDFEHLGAFYLGKPYDMAAGAAADEPLLYDSKDLTTHAVILGMTGSGKTGLGVGILEEAAIDGVPAIAIDPKGDLGNLLLAFPELAPSDFAPWIDEAEAARKGVTPAAYAKEVAERWRTGLAGSGPDPARIARYRDAVDRVIYTPGSTAGMPLAILKSFGAPTAAVAGDEELLRERVASTTSGLLTLLRVDADPVRSREHILVANLFDRAWREGRDLDLPTLI